MADSRHKPKPHQHVEVYWTNVTYRTVWTIVIAVLVIGLVGWKILHPSSFNSVLESITGKLGGEGGGGAVVSASQARFVNLDGRVEVRKVASVQWLTADYQMTLDKGDVIRTGGDGVARISFANGTTYVVKPETLITVETNSAGQDPAQRVSVHIRSGAVDLTTASAAAEVSFEDAVAQLEQNSRAAVRSDPESQQHEITVQSGGGQLQRGGQSVQIAQYERVSFPTGGEITISRVLAPPELTTPINLTPIIADNPQREVVEFRWRPVQGAAGYHLRVSNSSMFNQILAERRVNGPGATVTGLDPGEYFWAVTAQDAQRGTSDASEVRKFSLVKKAETAQMLLDLDKPKLHGNVVELNGRTEPGATLLVNGQTVPKIGADGRFQYFMPPMARGSQKITIIGQNRRGATASREVPIVIP